MITSLLKQAYLMDIDLWTENGKLKYKAEAGVLTESGKQQLIENKAALILRLEQNQAAKAKHWFTFEFGDMYSKRTGDTSELCIFRNEDDTFTVWRGSWKSGESQPVSERTIANRVSFQDAFDRANNYYDWSTNRGKRRKAG